MTSNPGNGGAISFSNQASGILTVSHCSFFSCTCTITSTRDDECGGGAIYVNSISKVEVSSSLFSSCACYSSKGCDGGAIELYIISSQPLVTGCIFHSCSAPDDGGEVSIWRARGNTDIFLCDECRFFSGRAGGAAGCLIVVSCESRVCSNCVFADSTAYDGGAVYISSSSSFPSGRYLLQFCFFKDNSVSISTRGNDVALENCMPNSTNNPIHHCFSTTPSGRVSYLNGQWYNTDENWLPQGELNNQI